MTLHPADLRPLFVTEKELASRLGFSEDRWRALRPSYIAAGLPSADPISGLRYWPRVKEFFDRISGIEAPRPADAEDFPPPPDGKENPHALRKAQGSGRTRPQHRPTA